MKEWMKKKTTNLSLKPNFPLLTPYQVQSFFKSNTIDSLVNLSIFDNTTNYPYYKNQDIYGIILKESIIANLF